MKGHPIVERVGIETLQLGLDELPELPVDTDFEGLALRAMQCGY